MLRETHPILAALALAALYAFGRHFLTRDSQSACCCSQAARPPPCCAEWIAQYESHGRYTGRYTD